MHPLLVTAALIINDGELLITRRKETVPYPLLWELPGGKVEPDEDPRDAIVRELQEELAIEAEVNDIYDVVFHRYPERTVLIIIYRCYWRGGEIRDVDVHEHTWVAPAELARFDFLPADCAVIAKIAKELLMINTQGEGGQCC